MQPPPAITPRDAPSPPTPFLALQPPVSPLRAMATGELTELERAIDTVVTVFFTYAGKEGKKGTLTAEEFKELVQLQLPNLMKVRVRAT